MTYFRLSFTNPGTLSTQTVAFKGRLQKYSDGLPKIPAPIKRLIERQSPGWESCEVSIVTLATYDRDRIIVLPASISIAEFDFASKDVAA